ncbi:DUF4192 domain-containing protein [Luteococcus sanguinis]|uniref:DUF4192 domain-containing protein n=1 Tax=Luteococcus sanguinis TaxID=174038 RepID=A0ABW1X1U7_9ACTN
MTTTTESAQARLTLHDTEDFLAIAPYLLGYQPEERLVAVVLSGRRLAVTAAMPLAAFDDVVDAYEAFMPPFEQVRDPKVALMAWTDDAELAEYALGLAEVWVGAEHLLDSVVVTSDRWWSRDGWGAGRTEELAHGRAAAEAVLAGLGVAGSRDDAVRAVLGPDAVDPAVFDAVERAWDGRHVRPADAVGLARQLMERPGDLPLDQVAALVVMVQDVDVRDAVWLAMDRAHAEGHLSLWSRIVAVTPSEWALVPVLLLGCASWVSGQGAVMVAAIERALDLDPTCSLAHLLSDVNRQALSPQVWEESRAAMVFGLPGPLNVSDRLGWER